LPFADLAGTRGPPAAGQVQTAYNRKKDRTTPGYSSITQESKLVKTRACRRSALCFLLAGALAAPPALRADDKPAPQPDEVELALKKAGPNRDELAAALAKAPEEQRKGMAFLIANMPDRDLQSLHADFLLENVDLACKARKEAAWGAKVPEEVFLNN